MVERSLAEVLDVDLEDNVVKEPRTIVDIDFIRSWTRTVDGISTYPDSTRSPVMIEHK